MNREELVAGRGELVGDTGCKSRVAALGHNKHKRRLISALYCVAASREGRRVARGSLDDAENICDSG